MSIRDIVLVHVPGHSHLGWVDGDGVGHLLRALEARGWRPTVWTVTSAAELRQRLEVGPPALYWPNAYVIDDADGPVSLPGLLTAAGRPGVGSGAAASALMLDKPRCQAALAAAGVPTPTRVVVDGPVDGAALTAAGLRLPVIVKPADRCGSEGIDLDAVCATHAAAVARATAVGAAFGRVLVEDFLASDDLTVTALETDAGWQTTTTWYRVDDRPGDRCPLDRRSRLLPWGGIKHMDAVRDRAILAQVEALAPRVCAALGVRDVTRFDGRLDGGGRLHIFDVNGMPALAWPDGVMVHQMLALHAGGRADFEVFADLVDRIARSASRRADRAATPGAVPSAVDEPSGAR